MQPTLNFMTVCVDSYPVEYANRTFGMLQRNLQIPFSAYCITDRPAQLRSEISPLTSPIPNVKGWWNKPLLFSKQMPEGYILYLDLDLIIIDDITNIVQYAIENLREIACYCDAIHWKGSKFSSSMMLFKSGSLSHIYDEFVQAYPDIIDFPGGDQVWTFPMLKNILYLDEHFPGFKRSLKFELSSRHGNQISVPEQLPEELKIIDFHGRPKPHELMHWNVVRDNWVS